MHLPSGVTTGHFRHRLSRIIALTVYALAPLPFGSVEEPWIAIWIVLLAVSLATANKAGLALHQVTWILILTVAFFALLGVVILQLSTPPSMPANPIWSEAGKLLNEKIPQRVSASASQPFFAIGAPLLFVLSILRAIIFGTEEDGGRQVARAICIAAVAYAAYSATMTIVGSNMLLWREKEFYLNNITGTFTNRNTAATYFGSALIAWLLYLLASGRKYIHSYFSVQEIFRGLQKAPSRFFGTFICAIICFYAVAASGSRAGLILTLTACILSVFIYFRSKISFRGRGLLVSLAIVAVLSLFLELWGGMVAKRIDLHGLSDSGRMHAYAGSLKLISDHPLMGIGLGNFEITFPSYRNAEMGGAGIWDKAHSTPIEIAVELGLPMFILIAVIALWIFVMLLRNALAYRRRAVIIGLGVGVLGILHSSIDFSLQIPGYAVIFAAFVGIGISQCERDSSSRGISKKVEMDLLGKHK